MSDKTAVCRGCGKILIGDPYWKGGSAYDPTTNRRCKTNFYGGYVCCRACDESVSRRVESSMPGAGPQISPSIQAKQSIEDNWPNEN